MQTRARRPDKTLADYLAIAISPVLIMALVGSLVFFLLEVTYSGQFGARLRWSLFWFVLAAVLISRISIQRGKIAASIYGVTLAGVTGFLVLRFISSVVLVWVFLALIWWCASKLTWDCTLIDEDQDASGEGLLGVAGFDQSRSDGKATPIQPGQTVKTATKSEKKGSAPIGWWQCRFGSRAGKDARPHAPGLWVVYFSLAALPIFGIGQMAMSQEGAGLRRYGFVMLAVYVASGLGLLLTTSFLNLRRYLRQRQLQMPGRMAVSWISLGTVLIAGTLIFSVLLPRPDAAYSLTALAGRLGSPERTGSEDGWLDESAAQGLARLGANGLNSTPGSEGSASQSANRRAGAKNSPNNQGSAGAPNQSSTPDLGTVLQWLLYLVFALVILWLIYRNRKVLVAAWRELVSAFLNFLRGLMGWPTRIEGKELSDAATVAKRVRPPPFASFRNPFASNMASNHSTAEVIRYSFAALQSWAYENGWERRLEQTPAEFAQFLSGQFPTMADELDDLTHLYGRVAYAGQRPPHEALQPLQKLWNEMTAPAAR